MRGVSVPTHQFAITANTWIESKQRGDEDRTITIQKTLLASSCRAYTRVVLRLRAQAEEEQAARMEEMQNGGVYQFTPPQSTTSVNVNASRRDLSRNALSRPTSPTSSAGHSMFSSSMSHLPPSHGYHHRHQPPSAYGNANGNGGRGALMSSSTVNIPISSSSTSISPHRNGNGPPRFKSPLFRLGHAPLLRVFVPSPEGEWLSDESVVDCEKELKRAGVLPLLRVGDVVWDAAVGDEGNVGRLVWDGNYLIVSFRYSFWVSLFFCCDVVFCSLFWCGDADPNSCLLFCLPSFDNLTTMDDTGSRLYVFSHRRASIILTHALLPAVVFPPSRSYPGEPDCVYGPLSVGRADCGEFAVVAG